MKRTAASDYLNEVIVLNPFQFTAAPRGVVYAEAKRVHGEFFAGCVIRNAAPAPADFDVLTAKDVAAYYDLAA